ncbi:MAG: hypothetical protein AAF851_14165 [Myxococcota bacterium]
MKLRLGAADWSARPQGRAAWRMDPESEPVLFEKPTSFEALVEWMRCPELPSLVGIDVGVGVPRGHGAGFRAWLESSQVPIERRCSSTPDTWSLERPFFRVPPGPGGLTAYRRRGRLTRGIDDALGGKSPFILSGIPGCVGSSCVQLWEYLRRGPEHVRLWPFDGPLTALLRPGAVVVGEIYPSAQLRALLPQTRLRKSKRADRAVALAQLPSPPLAQSQRALDSEDVFDAWVGLVQMAQADAEGYLDSEAADPVHEGGLLGSLA